MQRQELLQHKLEHWCAASIRAVANQPSARYRGHVLHVQGEPVSLQSPYLHLDLQTQDANNLRGVADGLALRLLHSDCALHRRLEPVDYLQCLVFDLLEQLRCESLAPRHLPGVQSNLRNRFRHWAKLAANSKLTENNIGLLIYSLLVVCWTRLLNEAVPEQVEAEIEATRMGLAREIGSELYAIKKVTQDQRHFAKYALSIAKTIQKMAGPLDTGGEDTGSEKTLNRLIGGAKLNIQWLTGDGVNQAPALASSEIAEITPDTHVQPYKIFNPAYDREVQAGKQIRAAQLKKLRRQLDRRVREQTVNCHRVARYLQQLLSSPGLAGWSFAEEEGYVDSARLARLISSPHEHRLFRQQQYRSRRDCVVSIVVDNSGSMTHHNEAIATLVDTLVRVLELANVTTEVLGFTTGDWSGGKAYKDWVAAGKPANPGRLNSVRHTIYKAAETPWRRARTAIAGMLRCDLFRESIDGEALEWAVQRIEKRPEQKKIIVMLSDGSPMDTATQAVNVEHYLDQHLATVADQIERRSDIQLCALGVGLDLSAFYHHNLPINVERTATTRDLLGIAELLGGREPHSSAPPL